MTRILTIECYGELPAGWVPCISWPLPELGDGKAENAPMLVPIGPQQWALRVAVRGAAADSCLTACVPGMRPLQFPDFNLGRGYRLLPPSVRWAYTLGPVLHAATTDIYYYSGWPSVRLRVIDGQDSRDFPLAGVGPGRTREETLWHVCLPTEDFTRRWGFLPLGHTTRLTSLPMGRSIVRWVHAST